MEYFVYGEGGCISWIDMGLYDTAPSLLGNFHYGH